MSDLSSWGFDSHPRSGPPVPVAAPPPPPPPPPGWGRPPRPRRWPWAVVALMVVALPASLVAAVYVRDRVEEDYPDQWDERVADLVEFVEDERDLQFDHPVPVDFLTDQEYSEQTRADEDELTDEDREDMDRSLGMLRALGLASGDIDLFEAGNDMADVGTLAYYDPGEERIVVRGTDVDVSLEVTLVHELTHVLQDQHFDLERELGEEDDDDATAAARWDAFTALVEGDAMRIENAFIAEMSDDELDEYFSAYGDDVDGSQESLSEVPAALIASRQAPYSFGASLVELIAADGGNDAVDDAFDDPPMTSEHMYDPRSYFDGDKLTELEPPEEPASSSDAEEGELGAVDLYIVLADRIDPLVALAAADGWGNARYVTYEQDDRSCVEVAMDGDTATDDQELRTALDAWVAAAPPESDASVEDLGGGHSLMTSCDPGTEVEASADRALDVLNLPVTRVQVAQSFSTGDIDEAWAIGDCLIHELTLDQLLEANESAEPTDELDDAITAALETCGAF